MTDVSPTSSTLGLGYTSAREDRTEKRQTKRSKTWEDVVDDAQERVGSDGLTTRANLVRLADQLHALASELETTGDADAAVPLAYSDGTGQPIAFDPAEPEGATHGAAKVDRSRFLALARARYEGRRNRVAVFDKQELFGEPGWDILLDLYIAFAEGKPVSVSSACIGSASPPTTGLRWLGVLQDAGLVERKHDERDQRRVLVHLSDKGIQRMEDYFRRTMPLHSAAHPAVSY